jgi:hypothetical protein
MTAAQPARRGMKGRHEISDRLRPRYFELLLLRWRDRLQIARHLPVTGRDEYQPLVLRALLEFEQALHRAAIVRITAQAVAGFGGIGDQTAASEVCGEAANLATKTMQWASKKFKVLMKLLAIPLGNQPKNFWPGTRKTVAKWLVISQTRRAKKIEAQHIEIYVSKIF